MLLSSLEVMFIKTQSVKNKFQIPPHPPFLRGGHLLPFAKGGREGFYKNVFKPLNCYPSHIKPRGKLP